MNKLENITNLTNKVALITGGGSGIGFKIAEQFINLGAKVVITGRDLTKLEKAKERLGTQCYFYCNDVTKKKGHNDLIKIIEEKVGPIEILVNNAGKHQKKNSLEVTDLEFLDVIDTNVNSIFSLTRAVLKFMIPRKKGSIINISSMTALYGIPLVVAYSSSKTALLGMTRALASEFSYTGVRFNAIAPGFIESKMFRNALAQDPERERKILSRTPMQRFGEPSDIAKAAAFLASDASEFVTGICLPVDGGNSIGF